MDWLERRTQTVDSLPQFLVIENPTGLLTCKEGGDGEFTLRLIYRELSDLGYRHIAHRTIHCAAFGDPIATMRERVIMVESCDADIRHILLAQVSSSTYLVALCNTGRVAYIHKSC